MVAEDGIVPPARGTRVAPVPRARAWASNVVRQLLDRRSLVVACALVAGSAAAYLAARETSVFAVRTVAVEGAPPRVAAQVRRAVTPLVGSSLVALDGEELERRLAGLPIVQSATYDRAFPHTLRLFVRAERPLVVVRRGAQAWLVSARARVLARVPPRALRRVPRLWVGRRTKVVPGNRVGGDAAWAIRRLATVGETRFLRRVRTIRAERRTLTLALRSGTELRLGAAPEPQLQVAVAAKVLAAVRPLAVPRYIDLTLPRRPVIGPQLEGRR